MSNRYQFFTRAFTRKGLFQLFMVCAFPIHVWAIIMAFRDFSWVAERTNTWDAVGLFSYAVVFALVETLGVFLIMFLIGLFMPNGWDAEKRLALLGTLFLTLAVWAVLGQVYSMNGYSLPQWIVDFLVRSSHPFRFIWGGVFLSVGISVAVPVIFILRLEKGKKAVIEIFDRITMLSSLYILFDIAGIVVLVMRNVRI